MTALPSPSPPPAPSEVLRVAHVVRGRVVDTPAVDHTARDLGTRFTTPILDLDELVWPRSDPVPALHTPVAEVVAFLVEVGDRLELGRNEWLGGALDAMAAINPLGRRIVEQCYRDLPGFFARESLQRELDESVGAEALDGWRAVRGRGGAVHHVRAFPPRLVHVLAGNAPGVAALSIARAALSKGVHLLKLPSNDLFTAPAILRTMAEVDSDHPVTRSFSAVYWKGGDVRIEGALFRPQYFDKLVAWGGESAIRHATGYLGPGFELVSFDPKVSVSLVGREAFRDPALLGEVAVMAAADAAVLNQDACAASRFQFVETDIAGADAFCELLAAELAVDRPLSSGVGPAPPGDLRGEVEVLALLEPAYRVFGAPDGRGLVVRSEEPVGFQPVGKTVNVVPVTDLSDAVRHATVATQTVGIFPPSRKEELRDLLAAAGVQRVVPLGRAVEGGLGLPHDGMYPLQRFVRWVADEGGPAAEAAP